VTRRRLHLAPERLEGGVGRLAPAERHYLAGVLRLAPGSAVEVFDGAGHVWDGEFTGSEIRLGARREAPPPAAPVWVAFALPRGEKADWVVQKATEVGVARLAAWPAERSVVRLDRERAGARVERWRRIAAEAARQCGRAGVPEVAAAGSLREALAAPAGFDRLVLAAGAVAPLGAALRRDAAGWLAVVGPEGGLAEGELAACLDAGCTPASLGPRVLRAETAAIVAAALIQHLVGDLG
jgi:16S rRNA (uracil1498-N3)-methyltransferase